MLHIYKCKQEINGHEMRPEFLAKHHVFISLLIFVFASCAQLARILEDFVMMVYTFHHDEGIVGFGHH
jgi:hypothetical protein